MRFGARPFLFSSLLPLLFCPLNQKNLKKGKALVGSIQIRNAG
jgi:hypothetical protein